MSSRSSHSAHLINLSPPKVDCIAAFADCTHLLLPYSCTDRLAYDICTSCGPGGGGGEVGQRRPIDLRASCMAYNSTGRVSPEDRKPRKGTELLRNCAMSGRMLVGGGALCIERLCFRVCGVAKPGGGGCYAAAIVKLAASSDTRSSTSSAARSGWLAASTETCRPSIEGFTTQLPPLPYKHRVALMRVTACSEPRVFALCSSVELGRSHLTFAYSRAVMANPDLPGWPRMAQRCHTCTR